MSRRSAKGKKKRRANGELGPCWEVIWVASSRFDLCMHMYVPVSVAVDEAHAVGIVWMMHAEEGQAYEVLQVNRLSAEVMRERRRNMVPMTQGALRESLQAVRAEVV